MLSLETEGDSSCKPLLASGFAQKLGKTLVLCKHNRTMTSAVMEMGIGLVLRQPQGERLMITKASIEQSCPPFLATTVDLRSTPDETLCTVKAASLADERQGAPAVDVNHFRIRAIPQQEPDRC